MEKIKVAIIGVNGKMGRIVWDYFSQSEHHEVVCGIDTAEYCEKELVSDGRHLLIGCHADDIVALGADVAICFGKGNNDGVVNAICYCLRYNIPVVCGTTGFSETDKYKIQTYSTNNHTNYFAASNFAINSVLTTEADIRIAKFNPIGKIVLKEYHHLTKVDAPSGTALVTAEGILKAKGIKHNRSDLKIISPKEWVADPQGLLIEHTVFDYCGLRIESIRGKHYVAKQVLQINGVDTVCYLHDAPDRAAYMPGVEMAIDWALKGHAMPYHDRGLLMLLKD